MQICASDFAGAEIHEHDPAAGFAHHVVRLDVAVQQPGLVHRGHGTAQIDADERSLLCAEHAAGGERLLERQTLDELHPETDGLVVLIDAVDRHDIRVAHASQQPRFLNHRGRALRIVHDLQRDFAFERRVPRQVDGPEPPATELAADFEPAP